MNYKIVISLFVLVYFSYHACASMQSFDQAVNQNIQNTHAVSNVEADDSGVIEKAGIWQFTANPGLNIINLVLFSGLVLLYLRSRKLKRKLLRTRSKLHNQSVRFTQRLDNLTLEQKELKKIIKEYAELQY